MDLIGAAFLLFSYFNIIRCQGQLITDPGAPVVSPTGEQQFIPPVGPPQQPQQQYPPQGNMGQPLINQPSPYVGPQGNVNQPQMRPTQPFVGGNVQGQVGFPPMSLPSQNQFYPPPNSPYYPPSYQAPGPVQGSVPPNTGTVYNPYVNQQQQQPQLQPQVGYPLQPQQQFPYVNGQNGQYVNPSVPPYNYPLPNGQIAPVPGATVTTIIEQSEGSSGGHHRPHHHSEEGPLESFKHKKEAILKAGMHVMKDMFGMGESEERTSGGEGIKTRTVISSGGGGSYVPSASTQQFSTGGSVVVMPPTAILQRF